MSFLFVGEVAINYLNSTNYMFFGGLIMAIAVEHSGLHNRVALRIIMMVGTSQARLMLGFMSTTMFLSMWISNTATTAMMLPIVDAVADAINQKPEENQEEYSNNETQEDSPHESEHKDKFNEDECEVPLNKSTIHSLNQMTMNSFNSKNPANNPESMVAFLPNVRRSTMERLPRTEDPRLSFNQKNTRQVSIDQSLILSKEDIKRLGNQIPIEIEVDPKANYKEETERNFLLMSIAYAANIGGTGVITGSPGNLVVPDVLISNFGDKTGLTFASWMVFAIPVMLVNTILAWLWLLLLQRLYLGNDKKTQEQQDRAMKVIKEKYKELGKITWHEIQVFVLFISLILLWFFQSPKFMPGWADFFNVVTERGDKVSVGSATPAILMSILLFVLPQQYEFWPFKPMSKSLQKSPSLLTWRLIETKMCWGVLFLLGGGFALAKASESSGLTTLMIEVLQKLNMESLPVVVICFVVCLLTVTITNIASNVATANIVVPILAKMAVTMCINPVYLTLPAGIVSSYAFALPVATPPNAIVFGHSTMTTADMMKVKCILVLPA